MTARDTDIADLFGSPTSPTDTDLAALHAGLPPAVWTTLLVNSRSTSPGAGTASTCHST